MKRIGTTRGDTPIQTTLFEVDFCINLAGRFRTIHSEFLEAISVSECHYKASELALNIPQLQGQNVHIFISD